MKAKGFTVFILLMAMVFSLLAGCQQSDTGETNVTKTEDAAEKTTEDVIEELPKHFVSKDLIELTIHLPFDEHIVFEEAEKMTNVRLKSTVSPSATQTGEVYNVMLASGKIPDIVHGVIKSINQYGPAGAYIPLDELIDEHAPNIKAFLESEPEVKAIVSAGDGKLYCLPFINDGEPERGYFVREDWLEKLNLSMPETRDDLYGVLKAFRENDPNENGEKDEIPFFARSATNMLEMCHMFGLSYTRFISEDGKVKWPYYTREWKDFLLMLKKWYDEGLIDPEIWTRGGNSRDVLLGENLGGMTRDWFGSTAEYNVKLKDKVPGFSFVAMPPPVDINGRQWEPTRRERIGDKGWAIGKNNEHVIETIKYFDFWYSEEGRRLMNFGREGIEYTMEDGKPVFKDVVLESELGALPYLRTIGAQTEIGTIQDYNYELQWVNEHARKGVELYRNGGYYDYNPIMPKVALNMSEQKVSDNLIGGIWTYSQEMTQKFMLGTEDIETEFDKYMQIYKEEYKIEEWLEVSQSAYDRAMSNK
jgi:putative aldouronate transport system substrate-binding protein